MKTLPMRTYFCRKKGESSEKTCTHIYCMRTRGKKSGSAHIYQETVRPSRHCQKNVKKAHPAHCQQKYFIFQCDVRKLQKINVKYKTIFYPRHISVYLLQCEGENKRKNPLITSGGVLKNKCFYMLTCVEHTAATWAELTYNIHACMS